MYTVNRRNSNPRPSSSEFAAKLAIKLLYSGHLNGDHFIVGPAKFRRFSNFNQPKLFRGCKFHCTHTVFAIAQENKEGLLKAGRLLHGAILPRTPAS